MARKYRFPYLAKHTDGAWKYQRGIPKALQPLLGGRSHFSKYVGHVSESEAGAVCIAFGAEHDALFAKLRTMSAIDQIELTDLGGLDGATKAARYLPSLEYVVGLPPADPRALAASVAEQFPGSPMAAWSAADHALGQTDAAAFMIELRDKGRRALSLLRMAAPASAEFGFEGLLRLWVRSFGPGWRGRTDDHKRALDKLREALGGECDYRQITQTDIAKFRDHNETEGVTPATQRKRLESLSAMFSVALSEGHIDANPCAGVKVRYKGEKVFKRRNGDDRPFSGAQMSTILATAERERFGGNRHDAVMWVLRLLVWTGARPQEIVQLQRGDVGIEAGVPVIRIREACAATAKRHDHKTVKNAESIRVVPLHPQVAGFVEYAAGPAGEFVFSCFKWNRTKGRRGWFDNHFGPFMRETCGIKDQQLSLYSMRHAFHTAMRTARIDRDAQRYLVGHGSPDIHGRYGRGPGLKGLAADVARVNPLSDD